MKKWQNKQNKQEHVDGLDIVMDDIQRWNYFTSTQSVKETAKKNSFIKCNSYSIHYSLSGNTINDVPSV